MSCCGGADAAAEEDEKRPEVVPPPSTTPPPDHESVKSSPSPTESSPPPNAPSPSSPSPPGTPPSALPKVDLDEEEPPLPESARAMPLALSSMARMDADTETPGSLLGLYAIIHHAMTSCSKMTPLLMSDGSGGWKAQQISSESISPKILSRALGFDMAYVRRCLLYNGAAAEELLDDATETWEENPAILGCISLYYAAQDIMEEDELIAVDDPEMDGDLPATVLYKATVHYKTRRPSSGMVQARQAEELSMLTFGASVDDDVKLGALSSLYDKVGKYRLEIESVRKKTYTFDSMDTVLSDGSVPSFESRGAPKPSGDAQNGPKLAQTLDPFVKSVAVVVQDSPEPASSFSNMTTLTLSLVGRLRDNALETLEGFHSIPRSLKRMFPVIGMPRSVLASQCRHALLLDRNQAGRVYVDGRLVAEWGDDVRMATSATALFGMEIVDSVPVWHGRIVDFAELKKQYAAMWQELLIDARHADWNLASKLLSRLIHGRDPDSMDEDEGNEEEQSTDGDCLESDVMSSSRFDPVGICAKALATRFAQEYGKSAVPCLAHEVDWVRVRLGSSTPVVVPERALKILRRGGYFDVQRTIQELWFSSPPVSLSESDNAILLEAVEKLKKVGCDDIAASRVVFVDMDKEIGAVQNKLMCRYDSTMKQYYVNRSVMKMKEPAISLGMYLALENPDGYILSKYMLAACAG